MSDLILSPNDGQLVWIGGLGIHFKLDGSNTQGAFSVVEHPLEPGAFAPPHTHSREDEFSYVLEGTIGVMIGGQEFLVTSGSYIVKPRGILHSFWNPGPEPARLLEIIAQIYRYRAVSTPVQRQQTKWIVFAIATIILAQLVLAMPGLFNPSLLQPDSLYSLITSNIFLFVLLIAPVSIYIAIMRYGLYDIDVIINRSLVYGSLTVLLALIYFGLVIGLGSIVHLLTGQVSQSPVVIVASTVAIFVLIQPLRHRIQRIIDRRFYRSKYDAATIIANFNSTLREEVDLNTLSEHLVAVVQETMQPAHVSLWLRSPAHQPVSWSTTPAIPSEDKARGET